MACTLSSPCTASLFSGPLLIRSLGTIGFRDVTETNDPEFIPVTSQTSIRV